jgi:hypothetical protein
MKTATCVLGIMLLTGCSGGGSDNGNVTATSSLQRQNVPQGYYAFIGDSITNGFKPNIYLQGYDAVEFGNSGEPTSYMVPRMTSEVIASGAAEVFILGGINDVNGASGYAYPVQVPFNNIIEMTEIAQDAGIKPYVQSVLHTCGQWAFLNPTVTRLNTMLKEYCLDNEIEYIDLNEVFAPNGVLLEAYTFDCMHPNDDGYKAWATLLTSIYLEED